MLEQGPLTTPALAPPGFLCSEDAMEYSKEFVTAVVLGKDLVPRRVASHKSLPVTTVLASCSCLLGASPSDAHLPRESQSPQSERTGGPTLPDLPSPARPC